MQALLRFQVVVLLVCAGFAWRASASKLGTQSTAKVTTRSADVGESGSGQQFRVNHAWSAPAAVWEQGNASDVLLVLDPNGMHCWETVYIDNLTNSTLLTWLHKQVDVLTIGALPGDSLPLQLSVGMEDQTDALTFTELIEEAWRSQADTIKLPSQLLVAFQMTLLCKLTPDPTTPSACLDSAHLKVTNVETFWRAVERTVAAGHLVPGDADLPDQGSSTVNALSNSVIVLPRIVTRLHPVHQAPEEHIYSDLAAWDVDFVVQMLQEFLRVSSARTIPGLAEYRILPDKVQLQNMYESYYAADPSTHTPPIPTVTLRLSHAPQRGSELCIQATESTSGERDAAKTALLDAVFALEKAVAPEHPIRHMVDAGGSNWMGRYIIKREYSEGAHHIYGLTLPELSPLSVTADDMHVHDGKHAADAAPSALADKCNASRPEGSSDQPHTPVNLPQQLSALVTDSKAAILHAGLSISAAASPEASAALQPLGAPSSDIDPSSHTCPNPDLAARDTADVLNHNSGVGAAESGSWAYAGMQLPDHLNDLLEETADNLLRHSCGEGWLVQPRIANMSGLEYRVYLLGGASAISKGPQHSAVVYTPCTVEDDGLHVLNLTLPEGMISSDVLPDPGETPDETVTTPWRSFNLWASPEMHSMILKAAHDGAQAMIDSPRGHLMRMVSNVMVRVDVVLGAQWDSNGQILLWPMINEMDWFNSAAMMTGFWKGTLPVNNEGQEVAVEGKAQERKMGARVIQEMQSSAGFKLAQALYNEISDM